MPIFQYQCKQCHFETEDLQKHGDDAPVCPECAAGPMQRTIGLTNFRLRGSGWTGSVYSRFRRDQ